MRIQTEVVLPETDDTQMLSVEVDNDVITFYFDDKTLFRMDFEMNFEAFIIAIMKVWGNWKQEEKLPQKTTP